MDKLPLEVLAMIFDFFPLTERAKLREVSRCFKKAVEYNLKRVTQIEFECYSTDASAQNYLSRNSKGRNSLKSFWSFANSYCGQSIEINAEGHQFYIEDILAIASKLKFITCENIHSNHFGRFDVDMFDLFPQLEGFKMGFDPDYQDHYYTKVRPWCTSLLAQHREKKGKKILCLSLPCDHLFKCDTKRTELPVGLRRLMLNCNLHPDLSPHPPVTPEVSWSLVELRISGLPNLNNFSPAFSSLKKLTFMTETVKEKPIRALIHMFAGAIGQLEEFTFVGDVSARAEREIYTLAAHGKHLRTFIFIHGFYNEHPHEYEEEEGEEEEPVEEVLKIELDSPKLKRLVIQTRRPIAVKVTARRLHHFEIKRAPSVVALDVDCCHLAYFKLVAAEISFDLPQLIASARRLRFLILENFKLPRESVARIISSLNENRSIQKVHLKDLLEGREGPTERNFIDRESIDQIVYTSLVTPDFELIVSNLPDLQNVNVNIPDLVIVLDDNIRAMKIERGPCRLINRTPLDGTRCSVTGFVHAVHFYFPQAMSNLRIFSVYVQAITPQLVSHLEARCHNIRGVGATGSYSAEQHGRVPKRWTEWIASLKDLRVIFGSFTQHQMIDILDNLKTNKLVVYNNLFSNPRTLIEDQLHELILDLSQRQVLVKYSFPWRCSCGAKCPLFNPPSIIFGEMESYV